MTAGYTSLVFVKKSNLFLFYENIQVKDKSPIKENDVVQENNMDSEAFKTCIENHGKAVYSFCRYLTRERFDADDLYQQTFLVAFEKGEISEVGNPRSYLITIAANLWNNMKRKKGWRAKRANIVYLQDEEMNQLADDRISVEDAMIKNEEAEAVRKLVDRLPDKLRIVLLMYYTEEMKLEEIATALQIPVGTVKSRMNQAKKRIKERMEL